MKRSGRNRDIWESLQQRPGGWNFRGLLLIKENQMQTAGSLEKTLMLGKTEGRTRTGVTEEKTAGWHHRLNGREFEQTLGSLACCSPRSHKKSGTTEGLNNKKENLIPEVNEFSAFQRMGRCKNLDSLKPLFDMCRNNLDSVSCFSPPSAPAGAPSRRGCRS